MKLRRVISAKSVERTRRSVGARVVAMLAAALICAATHAQTTTQDPTLPAAKPAAPEAAPEAGTLSSLAWLEGCWRGTVNQREYREQWMPLRGNLLVGVSHTVSEGKTQGYEYLRIEPRADGLYYVAAPTGKPEEAFRFVDETTDRGDRVFTFSNPAREFPQKIIYRRATEGWLYATVEGKVGGAARQVIYPMRRIACESGELILR